MARAYLSAFLPLYIVSYLLPRPTTRLANALLLYLEGDKMGRNGTTKANNMTMT
jgi:hypothetical protein